MNITNYSWHIHNNRTNDKCEERIVFDTSVSVEDVKSYAMTNYERGGHRIIECWSDSDIEEWIDEGHECDDMESLIDLLSY